MDEINKWTDYYDAVEGRAPRPILLEALGHIESSHIAIDIGCGVGNETKALLNRGWQVIAIDQEKEALARLEERINGTGHLVTQLTSFEHMELQPADLIHSSYALPFCPPSYFDRMWQEITSNLKSGGIFVGHLFGINDAWRSDPEITFHTRDQVQDLLTEFEVIKLVEEEGERGTATGETKYWHTFEILARKL